MSSSCLGILRVVACGNGPMFQKAEVAGRDAGFAKVYTTTWLTIYYITKFIIKKYFHGAPKEVKLLRINKKYELNSS